MNRASHWGNPPRLRNASPERVITWTLLFLGGIVMVIPFAYMLGASFKLNNEIYELSLLPREPTLDNYRRLFERSGFLRWFGNSLLVGTLTTASVLFFDSLVGYTLAKFRFRGRYLVFVAILSTLMIPTEMLVLPWYSMAKKFGWLDTYWGIAFPGLMTGFGDVPDEAVLRERARRAPRCRAPRRPQRVPGLVAGGDAAGDARAVGAGDLHVPRQLDGLPVAADRHHRPQPLYIAGGFASFSGEFQTEWEMVMTGASVATIPTIVVFLLLQRYIIRGIVLAGLKA